LAGGNGNHAGMTDLDEVERCLDVGRPAVLYIQPRRGNEISARMIIRGWQRGSYVLLDMPGEAELGISPRAGDSCKLRFLADGDACGLDATLLDLGSGSHFSYVRMSWPHSITLTRVRKHQRAQVRIPCTISPKDGEPFPGTIQDLSAGGCRIESDRTIAQGALATLGFELPGDGGAVSIELSVCAAGATQGGAWLGCKWAEVLEDRLRYEIEFIVATAAAKLRAGAHHTNHVLVITGDLKSIGTLNQELTAKGYEVTVAPSIVDGFYWLRAAAPALLILASDLKPFRGIDVLKTIRELHSLSKLPVIMFGGPAVEKKAALEAGVAHYFESATQVHEMASAVESILKNPPKATKV